MSGVSLSAHGLRVEGGIACPEGGGHKVNDQLLIQAKAAGSAEGHCTACGALVKVVRA